MTTDPRLLAQEALGLDAEVHAQHLTTPADAIAQLRRVGALADLCSPLATALLVALDERDENEKSADLHRKLNERVAGALGLLEMRTDPETGEEYLPSWHDMPKQVETLRAERDEIYDAIEKMEAALVEWNAPTPRGLSFEGCLKLWYFPGAGIFNVEGEDARVAKRDRLLTTILWWSNDRKKPERAPEHKALTARCIAAEDEARELRLTLAAEQGRPEGAPSAEWEPKWVNDILTWRNKVTGAHLDAYIDRRSASDVRFSEWRWYTNWPHNTSGRNPSARAAMKAADKALSGEG